WIQDRWRNEWIERAESVQLARRSPTQLRDVTGIGFGVLLRGYLRHNVGRLQASVQVGLDVRVGLGPDFLKTAHLVRRNGGQGIHRQAAFLVGGRLDLGPTGGLLRGHSPAHTGRLTASWCLV